MAYNQPFQPSGVVSIVKRPITDQEQSLALIYYGMLRKGSRGIATASMFLAVLNLGVISGALPLADLVILIAILGLAVGLAAVGMGAMTLKARKQIDAAFKEGVVYEVRAPAYLNRAAGGKAPMWNIGPISVMQTPELQTILVEGAPASVLCVPGVKAALSVNGVVLKRGATITMPPNLAQMAQLPATAQTYEPVQQPGYYPQQQQPPLAAQPQQAYSLPMQQQPFAPQPQQPPYPAQPQPVYAPQQQPMFQQPQQRPYAPQAQQPYYAPQAQPPYPPQQQPQQPAPVIQQGSQYPVPQQPPAGPPQTPYPGQYPPGAK